MSHQINKENRMYSRLSKPRESRRPADFQSSTTTKSNHKLTDRITSHWTNNTRASLRHKAARPDETEAALLASQREADYGLFSLSVLRFGSPLLRTLAPRKARALHGGDWKKVKQVAEGQHSSLVLKIVRRGSTWCNINVGERQFQF